MKTLEKTYLNDKQKQVLKDHGATILSDQWFTLSGIDYYIDVESDSEYAKGWDYKTNAGFYNAGSQGYTLIEVLDKAVDMVNTWETKEIPFNNSLINQL